MGAGCETQVKNNRQVSSRTSNRGHLHWMVRLGGAILANRLVPPSGPSAGDGPHSCQNKCGSYKLWVGGKFFEMNISLIFYHNLSWGALPHFQPHFLGPKIVFSFWSSLRLDSLEKSLPKSLPP